ncbi:MAG: DUF4058 family protein [Caldilineaceae bacterium]|nr:DUF4058 family protein [Caldilineaceae bacterium]
MHKVEAVKNQYVGINAHLHSYWQADGEWHEFHTAYIVYLIAELKRQLRPLGYTAGIESSLQIRRMDEFDSRPESDIGIYDLDPTRVARPPQSMSGGAANAYDMVLDLPSLIDHEAEPAEYRAIAIYEARETRGRGEPVAWIEILSPANKPGGRHDEEYLRKRDKLFDSALVFVEIDFLHESPPTFRTIPTYYAPKRKPIFDPNAHPYHLIVIDPRPMFTQGKAHLYHFDVEMSIPVVTIPLSGDDVVEVDLQTPYNRTLEATFFTSDFVDYAQLPQHFDRYSPADQQRIANRMVAVLQAAHAGKDLESASLELPTLSLEDALTQIQSLTQQQRS